MPAIATNIVTSAAAAAIVAVASLVGIEGRPAYEDGAVKALSEGEATTYAQMVFDRADLDADAALGVDEFASLTIVTAELAHLNGFISVEKDGAVETIALPISAPGALGDAEQTRIDAVARNTFYAYAGEDGKMQQGEYVRLQQAIFAAADLNANGALARAELSLFAQRQAFLSPKA